MNKPFFTEDIKDYLSLATKEIDSESYYIVSNLVVDGQALDLFKSIVKTGLYDDILNLHEITMDSVLNTLEITTQQISCFVDIVKSMFIDNVSLFKKITDKPFYKLIFLGALPFTNSPEVIKYCTSK